MAQEPVLEGGPEPRRLDGVPGLLEVVMSLAAGELGARMPLADHGDEELDAIALGINMLAEELEARQTEMLKLVLDRTRQLEAAKVELERSNEELGQFAYVASHDLQEPLRMVSSYMQLLQKRYQGHLDADADEFIGYAVDGAKRMQQLINDLLVYARVGTQGRPLTAVDPAVALARALSNLGLKIAETGSTVVAPDRLPAVLGDELQLVQLWQNLVSNGIKFRGRAAPRIEIGSAPQGDHLLLSVRDNGIGIEPQYAERIFAVFQRLHTRSEFEGTGIGLAVAQKIVIRHGGRIWVESEAGVGSAFHFTLRRAGEVET